jgi:hypothetical protein
MAVKNIRVIKVQLLQQILHRDFEVSRFRRYICKPADDA